MAILNLPNGQKNINRIIAYGCSHTVGAETCDYEIYNFPPNVIDELKYNDILNWWNYARVENSKPEFKNLFSSGGHLLFDKLLTHEIKNSYPTKLSKLLGIEEVVNRAYYGASNDYMVWSFLSDIKKININENDLIIFGLTDLLRIMYIDDLSKIYHLSMSIPTNWPDEDFFKHYVSKFYSYKFQIWNNYKTLKIIEHYLTQYNIIVLPIHFDIFSDDFDSMKTLGLNLGDHYLNIGINTIEPNYTSIIGKKLDFKSFSKMPFYGGLHFKIEIHDKIAEQIANLIKL